MNERPMRRLGISRRQLFEVIERPLSDANGPDEWWRTSAPAPLRCASRNADCEAPRESQWPLPTEARPQETGVASAPGPSASSTE